MVEQDRDLVIVVRNGAKIRECAGVVGGGATERAFFPQSGVLEKREGGGGEFDDQIPSRGLQSARFTLKTGGNPDSLVRSQTVGMVLHAL